MTTDAGVSFWLDYVAAAGGLWENSGDTALSLLPDDVQHRHGQPEELAVTADPDAAREYGATLLTPGHPLLSGAAEFVLATGDCEALRLAPTSQRRPTTDQLLDHARGQFAADHGRLDLQGAPRPAFRQVLRVGALVTYALSSDDQFQEQLETWVDVTTCLTLPAVSTADLRSRIPEQHPDRSDVDPRSADLVPALAAANDVLSEEADLRERELSRDVLARHEAERQRAVDYYQEAEASLRRRMGSAAPDRAATLNARIASTAGERDRRLAEIDEKYRARRALLPFRLQLVTVPVIRADVEIRRGERRYPMVLDWNPTVRGYFAERCPHCRSTAVLVAGKDRLGCRDCLVRLQPPPAADPQVAPSRRPAPRPSPDATGRSPDPHAPSGTSAPAPASASAPASAPAPAPAPASASAPGRPPVTAVPRSGATPPKRRSTDVRRPSAAGSAATSRRTSVAELGTKAAHNLWQLTAERSTRLGRHLASDSPAAAAFRLFGADAALVCVGIDRAARLENVSAASGLSSADAGICLTSGEVTGPRISHRYQIAWRNQSGAAKICEVLPFYVFWPQLQNPRWSHDAGLRSVSSLPPPLPNDLDPVAAIIYRSGIDLFGLPVALRGLAAWWRVADGLPGRDAWASSEIAAAVLRAVVYRAGMGGGFAEVAFALGVDEQRMRAAGEILRRLLKLTTTTVW